MLHLLKIEWLKIKNYSTFWVLGILYICSITGINFIAHEINKKAPKDPMSQAVIGVPPFEFPQVWQTTTWLSSFLLFLPGLLIIISLTNEFTFKTHRQNIIDGTSRTQFVLVKLVMVFITAIFSTLVVTINAAAFGITEAGEAFSLKGSVYIGYFFIQAMNYALLAMVFSLLFKRSGIAIGVFFLYSTIIENLIAGLLIKYAKGSGYFMPLESSDNLIPFPFFQKVVEKFVERPSVNYLLMASILYLIAFVIVSKRKFETDDL